MELKKNSLWCQLLMKKVEYRCSVQCKCMFADLIMTFSYCMMSCGALGCFCFCEGIHSITNTANERHCLSVEMTMVSSPSRPLLSVFVLLLSRTGSVSFHISLWYFFSLNYTSENVFFLFTLLLSFASQKRMKITKYLRASLITFHFKVIKLDVVQSRQSVAFVYKVCQHRLFL